MKVESSSMEEQEVQTVFAIAIVLAAPQERSPVVQVNSGFALGGNHLVSSDAPPLMCSKRTIETHLTLQNASQSLSTDH